MRAECRSRLAGRAPAPGSVDSKRKHNGGGQNHGKPQGGTSGAAFMAGSIGLQPTSELPSIDNMGMMKWSMDSGSTHTNTPVRECIHEFVSASRPYSIVRDAGGNEHEVRGHGKVIMKIVLPNNEQTTLTMTEVNYVPTFTCNLSSWKRANMKYESRGDSEGVGWYLNGKLQFYGAWGTTSPILEGYPILPRQASACHYSASAENQSDAIKHLHEVCGHRSVHQLQHALKSSTLKDMSGLTAPIITLTKEQIDAFQCEACVANKQTRPSFPTSSTRFGKGKCLHIDLCGPLRAEGPDGEFYMLSVIDDGTRYGAVRFLPRKSDAADCTIELQKLFQTQMGVPTIIMRFDNGKEFINHRMMSYAKQHGIRVETTTPHTPQQNGVAERCNRTLMEMARTQLNAAGMSPMYWPEALRISRLPRHQQEAGKLSPVSDKGILVGYSQDSKAYRVLMDTGKVVESRDVSFLPTTHQVPTAVGTSQSMPDFDVGGDDFAVTPPPAPPPQQLQQEEPDVQDEQTEVLEPEGAAAPTPATTLRISGRSNKGQPPERYVAMKAKTVQQRVVMHSGGAVQIPKTWRDVLLHPQSANFKAAMVEEKNSIFEMGVLEPVISWRSRLQPTIADSSCEAEFMAAAEAIKEALWFKKLLPNLGVIDEDEAVMIMCDNESAEAVLRSPRINEVSKHISRKWNFAKESVALNEVKIEHVSTAKQVADIFTKPLERQKFEAGRLALGVKAWPV
ncbi:hypothetical protein CEUSTIGMA_g6456.t1 [Chlamydomonas eustigma]|uniref:Integrase catalytic domain-containing protein n=1 Tax=Chlamydomonas eustigma TaxID=1157962 RepID=A0A250X7I8_9CHLO|nr:hypothetical protein CEUSTIGMA_g6456.t1 [Chlamydomonas eustigma]|eukprot:GAX79016.1 hypothetical protein CEUSTIGMA_g6456.t1 [Chlamydomonas eustigma]